VLSVHTAAETVSSPGDIGDRVGSEKLVISDWNLDIRRRLDELWISLRDGFGLRDCELRC
jgi:hypothetical protein